MNEEEVKDAVSNTLWKEITKRSHINTEMYREIFGCDPDDTTKTTNALMELRSKIALRTDKEQFKIYERLKGEIKGHIVEWPTNFLKNEDLTLSWKNIEKIVPEINFI